MTTGATTLLGLALPVQGELSGTWGDVVNASLTNLLDTAVAGTTALTTDADVTLTTTTLSANQARQAVLLCTGARTAIRNITAPAQSKAYVVINATTGGFATVIRGVGPTTGVSIPAGKQALVAWGASDFVLIGISSIDLTSQVTGVLPVASGGTGGLLPIANGGTNAITAAAALVSLGARTSATGSAITPAGTTAQRDVSPAVGYFRYNSSTAGFEGYNGSVWGSVGGGATGGGADAAFSENDVVATVSYTIGQAAYVTGVTVTIAVPGVFTLANHGFVAEQVVHLSTTGALPTGLAVDTPYYVIATGLTTSAFQLSATLNGVGITTTGTQSGVHSVGKIKNAETAGPFSIATGVTVTVPTGATWSIV